MLCARLPAGWRSALLVLAICRCNTAAPFGCLPTRTGNPRVIGRDLSSAYWIIELAIPPAAVTFPLDDEGGPLGCRKPDIEMIRSESPLSLKGLIDR